MRARLSLVTLLGACDLVMGLEPRPESRVCAPGAAFGPGADVPLDGRYSVEGARFNPTRTNAYLSLCALDPPTTSEPELKARCDLHSSAFSPVTGQFTDLNRMDGVSAAGAYDSYPTIAPDAQHIVFGSARAGNVRLFVAAKVMGSFDDAMAIELPGTARFTYSNEPYLLGDGQTLYFGASPTGGPWDLYRARGPGPDFGASDAVVVPGVASARSEFAPVVSDHELEIFFASDRDRSDLDIYTAVRASPDEPFGEATRLSAFATAENDYPLWISPDGCELYYVNKSAGVATLRVTRR